MATKRTREALRAELNELSTTAVLARAGLSHRPSKQRNAIGKRDIVKGDEVIGTLDAMAAHDLAAALIEAEEGFEP